MLLLSEAWSGADAAQAHLVLGWEGRTRRAHVAVLLLLRIRRRCRWSEVVYRGLVHWAVDICLLLRDVLVAAGVVLEWGRARLGGWCRAKAAVHGFRTGAARIGSVGALGIDGGKSGRVTSVAAVVRASEWTGASLIVGSKLLGMPRLRIRARRWALIH